MKLWGYYAWHTLVNTIKKMFRSTVLVVLLAIVGFGVICGLVGGLIGSAVESEESTEISCGDCIRDPKTEQISSRWQM